MRVSVRARCHALFTMVANTLSYDARARLVVAAAAHEQQCNSATANSTVALAGSSSQQQQQPRAAAEAAGSTVLAVFVQGMEQGWGVKSDKLLRLMAAWRLGRLAAICQHVFPGVVSLPWKPRS